MISWIQNHLIRHGRWIFITLLAIIIIAFVFTIGNTPGCTTNQSGYEKNLFYGYDLNSSHEMEDLAEKVSLSAVLSTGRPIQSQQQFESALTSRIALLYLADEMKIPAPSENSLARDIQSKAVFRGPDGQFSRDAYTRFVDNIESNPRMRQDLIVVVLKEDYRIGQVEKVLSGPGYFLTSEALSQVRLNETTLKLTTAEISYSEFDPEIKLNEDELIQFYTNNIKRYEIPERIRASYVKFPADKYVDQLGTFSEEELREHFITNRARFVAADQAAQPTAGNTDPKEAPSPAVTFEDVRSEVAADLTTNTVQKLTNKAAQNFALTLYRNDIIQNSPEFQELLNENDLKIIEIPPYTAKETSSRGLPAKMLESAFALNEKRYFSDAYQTEGGFGVLIFSGKRMPPETPAYTTVTEAVKVDYSAEEKRRLFNDEGKRLESELSARLDAGTKFIKAAKELGLNVTTNEAFKASEAPREINRAALQRAQNMKEGEISPMITSGDSGIFIYIEEKTVPEIEADNEKLAQTSGFLKRYAAFISSNALLNELVSKGLETKVAPE
ncbi:MAG: peptidyl-prolyl cis-trans isomerase D [Lentimonas sp.]|jgi:peptidyl-prolyl cis-trans isomerase D